MASTGGAHHRQVAVIVLLLTWLALINGFARAEIYFVLMEDEPVVTKFQESKPSQPHMLSYAANHLTTQHDLVLSNTLELGSYEKIYSYSHVINGFAVKIDPGQKKLLELASGVRHIQKTNKVKLSTTHTPKFLGLPTSAWPKIGGVENAGEGMVIGMVDTGINPIHPSFQNTPSMPYSKTLPHFHGKCDTGPMFPEGSCNGKLIAAQYFNKAMKAAGDFNASLDYESPFDQDGHGTHTASTAAGNHGVEVIFNDVKLGEASGMAPRARVAAYRCLFTDPSSGDEADVVAAIDQAVQDGVDIISISLNYDPDDNTTSFLTIIEVAMLYAHKAGVFIANSAGNNGPRPSSMRSNSPWVTTVASSTTDREYPCGIVLGDNSSIQRGYSITPGTPKDTMYPIVASTNALSWRNRSLSQEFPCQNSSYYDEQLIKDSILLCIFTGSEPEMSNSILLSVEKTTMELGAMGFILDISNATNPMEQFIVNTPAFVIKFSYDSQVFFNYFRSAKEPKGKILGNLNGIFTLEAPFVSTFSARGPSFANIVTEEPVDILKPNILAPGQSIWGAYTPVTTIIPELIGAKFALTSGTSMAAPHVAGVAALVKQMNPSWSAAAIASALSTTATTKDNTRRPIHNSVEEYFTLANPFDFGSGFLNANRSLDPGLIFDAGFEDYISFACSVDGVSEEEVYKAIGEKCHDAKFSKAYELNAPFVVVTMFTQHVQVQRCVTNVASIKETYKSFYKFHDDNHDIEVNILPTSFTLQPNETLNVTFNITSSTSFIKRFKQAFGEITFQGDQGHFVRIPIILLPPKTSSSSL